MKRLGTFRRDVGRTRSVGVVVVLFGAAVLAGCGDSASGADRQSAVRDAGADVMPFDLDKTVHAFVKNASGGEETVVALDERDATQVALIRGHLKDIASEFEAGNFEDPQAIHGKNMAGLRVLEQRADEISIAYSEVLGGASITYSATSPEIVSALHRWFDAQVTDHGTDAVSTPIDHQMTKKMWRQHHPGEPYPGSSADR